MDENLHFHALIKFIMHSTYFTLVLLGTVFSAWSNPLNREKRAQPCEDPTMCRSQWGYCGTDIEYCGKDCQAGPCLATNTEPTNAHSNIINEDNFACVFNTLDNETRSERFNGLVESGWQPANEEEAAVFLAHVFHETDGLQTIREYCAPECGADYAASWCEVQGQPRKLYYGRGWLQLSWPCNYYAAGQTLNFDLLSYPELVEIQQDLAILTALWYYKANGIDVLAQQGDFAATTRKINGKLECDGGPNAANQIRRVEIYARVRSCFGLGAATKNPTC